MTDHMGDGMRRKATTPMVLIAAALFAGVAIGQADPTKQDETTSGDPNGILLKRIPEKLVVLTFDDGCASHATIVAPILKSLGFGGSFYVCDFDSFRGCPFYS